MLVGLTDWHSHILPGVDDGIKTMDDSLKALELMETLGVKHLWLTPHIMEDCPNEVKKLRQRFEELKLEYNGGIQLHLAAENMLDSLFEERLENKDLLPIGEEGNHLLVETSYFNPPMNMDGMLQQIKEAGYFPVLAHPERYQYMDEKDYKRLKEMGILFQGNYFSSVGAYGQTARKKFDWLLKNRLIDVIGSDLHRVSVLTHLVEKRPQTKASLEALKLMRNRGHLI